ncbi:MAG: poly-gamma-glutamate hydrolase family protein [Acidimicrobiia bacterium]
MLADLLAHDGVCETLDLGARFGFMAIHGGSLERGTAEVARRAAGLTGGSLYAVEQPDGLQWHVPSHLYDPAASPKLLAFLDHVDVVVSVHGYGREGFWTHVLLGGADRELARVAAARMRPHLDGFDVIDDVDAIPRELRGVHPKNPCNLTRRGGIQVELPPRVRGLGPRGEPEHVEALVRGLAAVFA